MANYSQLQQSVKDVIKSNGQQQITGDVLQGVLLSIIQNLGTNAQYMGVATPSTNPGTPDGNVFYFAVQTGTYPNMGNLQVSASDGLSVFVYNGTWAKAALGVALKTDITGVQKQITQLNTKITAAKNLIQRINAYIEETAAADLGITYQNLLSGVQNGDIKALQDPNGSLYGVIVNDGTLYAYCQVSTVDGAYPLAGASYILTDAGSGNIKIERSSTEMKLPYLDGNNKIPESMLPDNIAEPTVYDLTKIDALTGGSSSADVKAAFTPLSGGSSRSVPQVGDILRTNGTDYPYDDIVVYAQSTDNGEGIKSFKYLSGAVIRTIQVMPDFSAVNVTETDLAKTGYEPHVDFELQSIASRNLCIICDTGTILNTDEIAFFRHKKTHILNNGYKDSGNPKRKFKSGWIRSTGLCFDQSLGENIYPFGIPKSLAIKPYTIFKYDEFGKDVWELCPLESEAVVSGLEDFYDFCQFGMTRVSSEDTLTIRTGHGWNKKNISAADSVGVHRSITCGVAVYRNGKRVSDIKPFKIVFTKINKTTDGIIDKNDIKVTFRV